MTTTTTTAPTTSTVGRICSAAQLSWSADDWAEAFDTWPADCSYERSVLAAADDAGELSSADLSHLLHEHGFSTNDLITALAEQSAAGHACLPLWHAGQALVWLGY